MPNETLHIEEVKFWLKIMQEHAKFIRGAVDAAHADLLEESREFSKAFSSLLQKAERTKSLKQPGAFLHEAADVTREFCRYQRKLLHEKLCGKLGGAAYPFLLDHLLREAQCFLELLERLQGGEAALKLGSHTKSAVVWLRFMADHTKLVYHLIDPSERRMLKLAQDFSALFDTLAAEGRDLSSMLYGEAVQVRAFHRFLLDVRADVQRLRDFNRMAEELVADCRLLGVLTAEIAAHMKREAEHCLLVVALLEKEIIRHCPSAFQDDIDADVWQAPPESRESAEAAPEAASCPEEAAREETETECPRAEEAQAESPGNDMPELPVEDAGPVIAIFPTAPPETAQEAAAACEAATREAPEPSPENAVEAMPAPAVKPSEIPAPAPPPENITAPTETAPPEEVTMAAQPLAAQEETAAPPPEAPPREKERIYAKASDYKFMPGKYAGKPPGERVQKQPGHKLPRTLGKQKYEKDR